MNPLLQLYDTVSPFLSRHTNKILMSLAFISGTLLVFIFNYSIVLSVEWLLNIN